MQLFLFFQYSDQFNSRDKFNSIDRLLFFSRHISHLICLLRSLYDAVFLNVHVQFNVCDKFFYHWGSFTVLILSNFHDNIMLLGKIFSMFRTCLIFLTRFFYPARFSNVHILFNILYKILLRSSFLQFSDPVYFPWVDHWCKCAKGAINLTFLHYANQTQVMTHLILVAKENNRNK